MLCADGQGAPLSRSMCADDGRNTFSVLNVILDKPKTMVGNVQNNIHI